MAMSRWMLLSTATAAAQHGIHRLQKFLRHGVLADKTLGAGFQGLGGIDRLGMLGEDQDRDLGNRAHQAPQQFQASQAGKIEIQHDEIDGRVQDRAHRLFAARGFQNLDIGRSLKSRRIPERTMA
jgi:hypothetical protein